MTDLIRKSDALALLGRKLNEDHPELADELRDRIAALPAVTVGADAVLEAAHKYLLEQYGASPLAHPIDRARILAALEPVTAPDPAAIREAALREAAEVCAGIRQRITNGPMPEGARFDYEQAILAIIPTKGADHE